MRVALTKRKKLAGPVKTQRVTGWAMSVMSRTTTPAVLRSVTSASSRRPVGTCELHVTATGRGVVGPGVWVGNGLVLGVGEAVALAVGVAAECEAWPVAPGERVHAARASPKVMRIASRMMAVTSASHRRYGYPDRSCLKHSNQRARK